MIRAVGAVVVLGVGARRKNKKNNVLFFSGTYGTINIVCVIRKK